MKKTLLILENDAEIASILSFILEDKGYRTIRGNPDNFQMHLDTSPPSLILLDHWFNNKHGADICKQLKTDQRTAKIPLVLLSTNVKAAESAGSCGADDFLLKPFNINDLERIVSLWAGAA